MKVATVAGLIAVMLVFGGEVGWAALAGLIAVVAYIISLASNPTIDCWRCKGTRPGMVWMGRRHTGICRSCGNRGQVPRLGLRLMPAMRARVRERHTRIRRGGEDL